MPKRLPLFTLLLLCMSITGFDKQQIPKFPGDDDPRHDGQPLFCQNYDTKEYLHNCECKGMDDDCKGGEEGGGESPKCKVYCRKNSCSCHGCTT